MGTNNTIVKISVLVFIIMFCLATALAAQTGRWVEYDLAGFGSGGGVYDRGDGCLAYTKTSSQYFAIFDVRVGDWMTVDMGSVQNFQFAQTRGDVVMGWSDAMLVGYSSVLQTWDTVTYDGVVLYVDYQEVNRSYNCSDNMAFFATDEKLYVFDAAIGYWQEYAFTLPASFISGKYYVEDDYIALILNRSEAFSMSKNVVYSAITHTFNEIEEGARINPPLQSHGFVGFTNTDGSGIDFTMVGYSAFTNDFAVFTYDATDEACQSAFWPSSVIADEYTTYLLGFRRVVTPSVEVTCNFYGYDTYQGSWTSLPVSFDWDIETYYGNGQVGGQFAMDFSNYKDDATFKYFFYSGVDGSFKVKTPGIRYKSTYYGYNCGGTVFISFDTLNAWGYDLNLDRENYIALAKNKSANVSSGEDWGAFTRYTPGEETMLVYFYNGNTNNWTTAIMPYDLSVSEITSEHYYMYGDWSSGEFVYYSSKTDAITKLFFTPETSVSGKIRGDLAYARTDDRSYIFDGINETITWQDFNFNSGGLGTHSAAFVDTDTKTLYGYSTMTGNWTTQTIPENMYSYGDTGYVGLVTVYYMGSGYNKQYAYNSFADSWVELIPEGTHVMMLTGNKTILVVRSTKLYAFDPESERLCCSGMTGNINCSESDHPDISDVTRLIDHLYLTKEPLCCVQEADTDGSGRPLDEEPDISDVTYLIDYLYLSHRPLADCP